MIYITSTASSKNRISEAVAELAKTGFKNIELTGGTEFYDGVENDLFNLKKEHHLNFLIHGYFPPQPDVFILNLSSPNLDLKKKSLKLIKQAINLSKKFGKNIYSVHSGFKKDLIPDSKGGFSVSDINYPNWRENFYQNINYITDELVPADFKIALENLHPKAVSRLSYLDSLNPLITNPEEIEEFLEYYKDESNVGLLLDLGHLNVASDYFNFNKEEFLEDLFSKHHDKIFELHLSENDGEIDSHGVLPIDSWQIEFLLKNKEIVKNIPLVFEWRNSANPSAFQRFKMIKDKLNF